MWFLYKDYSSDVITKIKMSSSYRNIKYFNSEGILSSYHN
jgi:hypothetical protein